MHGTYLCASLNPLAAEGATGQWLPSGDQHKGILGIGPLIGGNDVSGHEVHTAVFGREVVKENRGGTRVIGTRSRWQAFARRLARAFVLRPEIRALADDSTIVCRCEDLAQCQATHALRHGPLPGPHLRQRHRHALRLAPRFGSRSDHTGTRR
eukprot:gene32161-39718_t